MRPPYDAPHEDRGSAAVREEFGDELPLLHDAHHPPVREQQYQIKAAIHGPVNTLRDGTVHDW